MSVTGALSDIARLNVFLRTADRVYLDAGAFRAETFDALFDGVYSLRWEDYCRRETKVIVNGKSVKSRLFALSACQKIVKKAITKRLSEKYNSAFCRKAAKRCTFFSISAAIRRSSV